MRIWLSLGILMATTVAAYAGVESVSMRLPDWLRWAW